MAVDVNAGHLAVAVAAADGNVLGTPATIPLDLAGLPAATRDGRLRAAISAPHRHRETARRPRDRDRGPGQETRGREPHRPGGGGAASPGATPDHPGSRPRTKETRHPTRHPAATRHQDRQAPQDNGRQPGDPGPSGAAG